MAHGVVIRSFLFYWPFISVVRYKAATRTKHELDRMNCCENRNLKFAKMLRRSSTGLGPLRCRISLFLLYFASKPKFGVSMFVIRQETNLFNTLTSGIQSLLTGRRVLVMLPNFSGCHSNWKSFHCLYAAHKSSSSSSSSSSFIVRLLYDFFVLNECTDRRFYFSSKEKWDEKYYFIKQVFGNVKCHQI